MQSSLHTSLQAVLQALQSSLESLFHFLQQSLLQSYSKTLSESFVQSAFHAFLLSSLQAAGLSAGFLALFIAASTTLSAAGALEAAQEDLRRQALLCPRPSKGGPMPTVGRRRRKERQSQVKGGESNVDTIVHAASGLPQPGNRQEGWAAWGLPTIVDRRPDPD